MEYRRQTNQNHAGLPLAVKAEARPDGGQAVAEEPVAGALIADAEQRLAGFDRLEGDRQATA